MFLSGKAKKHWSEYEGGYVLQSKDINGYLSWKHEKGNISIWYNINYGCWCIAPAENCGNGDTCTMFIQSQETCPHKITNIWNVFYNNWICDDTQINVKVVELTEEMEKEWHKRVMEMKKHRLSRLSIIEAHKYISLSHNIKYDISAPCCEMLFVSLSGKTKENLIIHAGKYTLQSQDINGYMSWKHVNGITSIWYDSCNETWCIGFTENSGSSRCFIHIKSQETCPHKIMDVWSVFDVFNSEWINDDTSSNVKVLSLCCKTLIVSLSGMAFEHQSCHAGEYTLQSRGINGNLSWKHVNGYSSIWYDKNNGYWCIGCTKHCGSNRCGIYIQSQETCPHKVMGVWNVINNDGWIKDDTPNNVKVEELCCRNFFVSLSGKAKEHQGVNAGEYTLQSWHINRHMSWKHINGNTSIWHESNSGIWCIGHSENSGSNICAMYIQSQESCPHKILDVWNVLHVSNDGWINDDTPYNVTILARCCRKLFVSLSGKAKENQSSHSGEYILQSQDINRHLSWKHVNGNTSIWYDNNNGIWCIGQSENCGSNRCGMYIQSQESCPHKIMDVWNVLHVSNDGWISDDTPNNVKMVKLCCSMLSVSLFGMAKDYHSSCAGNYMLQSRDINSNMSWTHLNGNTSIWYDSNNCIWCIGASKDCGSNTCFIYIKSQESCPHKISDVWNILKNNEWTSDDIQHNVQIQKTFPVT